MRLKITAALLVGLATATATLSVAHADNVIQQRQARMKEMGEQMKVGADMAKGAIAFDAAKAADIFKSLQTNMDGFVGLFPPGSDTGENKATANVWTDRAGFEAAVASFDKVVADAVATGAADVASFRTVFAAAGEGCRSCHQTFKTR